MNGDGCLETQFVKRVNDLPYYYYYYYYDFTCMDTEECTIEISDEWDGALNVGNIF